VTKSMENAGINAFPLMLDEEFQVVCGSRIYRAGLKAKISRFFCIQKKMTDMEKSILSLIENVIRICVHPFDKYTWALKMRRRGLSSSEIAKIVGIQRSTVNNWLRWLSVPRIITENEEVSAIGKSLQPSRRRVIQRLLNKEPFCNSLEKSLNLLRLSGNTDFSTIKQIEKSINSKLKSETKFYSRKDKKLKKDTVYYPKELRTRLIKHFRKTNRGFQEGMNSLLEEIIKEKEREEDKDNN